ncbi:O-antigen ligase family protein [Gluconacetobacter sacchari]|uniref:O-antigen ligase family protein n=2 Tax=Gluconacetobacter sacchari TaxID=92759 RepID=A0A7W4NJM1_9PROT|nr:O-antigen ligase family protein [Gluconacetobacter sacchari]MBB2158996.1 O-antigen ligase family protein [Gluconacetobacter sacchari]GBQ31425.1 O-antigen polymerase [Gluconacetobacter sacchari DSM 12717]
METHPTPSWVHRLSSWLLLLTLLYSAIGTPDFHRDALTVASTDSVNPINRFIWLALMAAALPLIRSRWTGLQDTFKAGWPLIALFVYFTCSTVWALDPDASRRRVLLAWVQIILVATLTSSIRDRLILIRCIFMSCVITACADLVTWVVMPGFAMTDEGLAGLQPQKNLTGLIMMYGLLAGGTLLFCRLGKQERRLTWAGNALLLALLLASRSKTSLAIILVMPGLLWLFFMLTRSRKSAALAIACGTVGSAIGTVFGYLIWCSTTNSDPMVLFRNMTFTGRTDLWSFMLLEIQKRPWFGAGFYSFWAINPAVQPSLKSSMWFGNEVHINEGHEGYIDLIATGGLVGLAMGVGILVYAITLAVKAVAKAPIWHGPHSATMIRPVAFFHLAFLLALSIHNFTESNLFSNNGLLAVALYFSLFELTSWNRQRIMHDPAHKPWDGSVTLPSRTHEAQLVP